MSRSKRLAVITEGDSEYGSLAYLYPQLRARTGNIFLSPLRLSVTPDAHPRIIIRECRKLLMIAKNVKRADLALVLLDREQKDDCPGAIATALQIVLQNSGAILDTHFILKDRAFENWLIADLDALKAQPARFDVTQAHRRKVEPNRADKVDGYKLMNDMMAGGFTYQKVKDSDRICRKMSVARAALHSRSLRHFLHMAGDEQYSIDCRRPASV
nr:DUF4276 family protein [Kribbella voronezhensis]